MTHEHTRFTTMSRQAVDAAPPDRPPRTGLALLEACGWLAAGILVAGVAAGSTSEGYRWANGAIGVCCWLLGVRVFLGHGGYLLSAPSIFGFAFSVFFGVGGIYHALLSSDFIQPWMCQALLLGYAAQVLLFFGFWRRRGVYQDPPAQFLPCSPGTRLILVSAGAVVLAAAVVWKAGGIVSQQLQTLTLGAAFAAVTVIAAALVLDPAARILSLRTAFICGLIVIFVQYLHGGTGRLVIVALGFTVASLYAIRFRTRLVKIGLVVCTLPVLQWMAVYRLSYVDSLAVGSSLNRTGLESAMRPPGAFAELLFAYERYGFELSHGRTFLSVPALIVPRAVWPGQPEALGYELARVTAPTRYGSGYSDASSVFGEWFFNFGFPGLLLMVVVIGFSVRWLDRLMTMAMRLRSDAVRLVAMTTVVVVCAGVPDVVWSGTHTYAARTLARLPLLLLLLVVVHGARSTVPPSIGRGGPSPPWRASPGRAEPTPRRADLHSRGHEPARPPGNTLVATPYAGSDRHEGGPKR
ncbi:O-antigen polymerase [Micromonospora marina]|uniref:O-antigen polymerase n=1 Tax=Micromonospora marina TaxID=307120 RepID=UPI0034546709